MKKKQSNPCYKCGKCCYNVPLPKGLLTGLKNRIVNEFDSFLDMGESKAMGHSVYPMTKDMKCPFLKPDNTCNIYDKRPKICRKYGISDVKLLQCPILYGRGNEIKNISPVEAANILISCMPECNDKEIVKELMGIMK